MRQLLLNRGFKDLVIKLNTEDQLFRKGIDSEGDKLRSIFARFGRYYADRTILIKEGKGQPTDRVTLKDTGDFYRSFDLILTNDNDLEITANTLKEDNDLAEVWGADIIGLTDENLKIVIEKAREIIIPIIRSTILGENRAA